MFNPSMAWANATYCAAAKDVSAVPVVNSNELEKPVGALPELADLRTCCPVIVPSVSS